MTTVAFSIYNASAGSGKTYTLVKAYLKILFSDKTDEAYKKILAITFTNKAVNEMKQRIVNSLYAFSLDEVPEKARPLLFEIAAESGLSLNDLQAKAKKIIKNIIHNYAAFDISTIDKFTHKVIRSFATDLNLPLSFEVSLDTESLLQEAVDAVIAKAGTDEELTQMLVEFSLDKADDDKSWDITHELLEIGKLLLEENNSKELDIFKEVKVPDFLAARQFIKTEITAITKEAATEAKAVFELFEANAIEEKSFSGQYFPNHLRSVMENRFSATSKKYREIHDIKVNKTVKNKEEIEALIPDFLQHTHKIYALFGKKNFYEAFLKNLTPLSLLNTIHQEMKRIQQEQNILSISQFNAIVHEQIKNQPAPFIYERLGEKYRHFFIDEFQDTSEMQWLNLIPLIDNALAGQDMQGTPGSLLIVGDPKQSIYRWRGGKAEQFMALSKGDNPFSNPSKETVLLDKNYRSYDQVVQFNNIFFKQVAHKFSNKAYHFLYAEESVQKINDKPGGYVEIQLLDKPLVEEAEESTKAEQYLKATIDILHRVTAQGFAYRDIVLLTRRRGEGVLLANYLTEHHIPVLSSETLLIQNATEVKVLLALLRYLKNENDKEAKALFLYFIAQNKQNNMPVHDFIAEGMLLEEEVLFERWLSDNGIPLQFSLARKSDLYAAVEYLTNILLKEQKTLSYVQYFMDVVLERTIRYQSSITDFLMYWEQNYNKLSIPAPENTDAVRIMTIHKSKGLEFPVVVFPFAEEDYSRSRDKIWIETTDFIPWNIPKALIDIKKEVQEYGEKAQQLFDDKKEEELLDNINVLYVALTRAEEQLYIISYKNISKTGLPNNMSSLFIEFLQTAQRYNEKETVFGFGIPEKKSAIKAMTAEEAEQLLPKRIEALGETITSSEIKIAEKQALMWDKNSGKAVEYGNLVHEFMSKIMVEEDIDKVIAAGKWSGLLVQADEERLKKTITGIIRHPELKMFYAGNGKVYTEQMILRKGKQNRIPDRIVIQDKKAFLLDYKTGIPQEKHKKQVEEYAADLVEMGFEVVKKSLVYIQEDELKIIHL